MKIKLGQYEIIIYNRSVMKDVKIDGLPIIEKAKVLIDYACYLYKIKPSDLATLKRTPPYPDCRKIISRTLYDLGLTEMEIYRLYGYLLGKRITIHSQISESRVRDNEWSKVFHGNLELMRQKFVKK